jgi:lipoprotein signal peptidase
MLIFFKKDTNLRYKIISLLGLIFFILDRLFKNLALHGTIDHQKNYHLALSFDFLPNWLVLGLHILITLILISYLIKTWQQRKELVFFISLTLIIIGALSNLIDRLRYSFVIDYIDMHFYYNNLADIYIWAGVVLLIIYSFKKDKILK